MNKPKAALNTKNLKLKIKTYLKSRSLNNLSKFTKKTKMKTR